MLTISSIDCPDEVLQHLTNIFLPALVVERYASLTSPPPIERTCSIVSLSAMCFDSWSAAVTVRLMALAMLMSERKDTVVA